MSKRPKAYSYLRFSTPEQLKGDTLRRQIDAAQRYSRSNDLDLDTDFTFRDLGVSAFRGKHAEEGALAAFIEAVDTGRVEPGSYLLVESLDRLSRERIMSALHQFSDLLSKGIYIVTLSDGQVYDSESINSLTGLIVPLVSMARANEESELKSKRLRAAWQNKRDRAAKGEHVLTRWAPAWLELKNGKFVVIERRAAVVRRIFEMALKGIGIVNIARQLNVEGVAPFSRSNGWYQSYVRKILYNEAVFGRFQPMRTSYQDGKKRRVPDGEPIDNYYPAIVSEADFYKVKHSRPGPSGKGKVLPRNVLNGIVFCKRCGGKMHYISKGPPPKGRSYLACDTARRLKKCDARSVPYQPVLNYVLEHLPEYQNYYDANRPSAKDSDREIDEIAAQIAIAEERIERMVDAIEAGDFQAIKKRLIEREAELEKLKAAQAELVEKRAIKEAGSDDLESYVEWFNTEISLEEFDETVLSAIGHLSTQIKRYVDKIILERDQPIQVVPTEP